MQALLELQPRPRGEPPYWFAVVLVVLAATAVPFTIGHMTGYKNGVSKGVALGQSAERAAAASAGAGSYVVDPATGSVEFKYGSYSHEQR